MDPNTVEMWQWLRKKNKLIGLICNTGLTPGFEMRSFLKEQGVAEYFDGAIFSDEVDVHKPDPRIFHLVTEKFRVESCEVVHMGDNLKTDVWGAKNAGFRAIHFSCKVGRDRVAESDPALLVSLSRRLGDLRKDEIVPDVTITSLSRVPEVIVKLEK